jgi:hypothetical protein
MGERKEPTPPPRLPSIGVSWRVNLGDDVADSLTGFRGIAVGRCEYLTGCQQILVRPAKLDKATGKPSEAEWYDEDRLVIKKAGAFSLPTKRNDGPDIPAPMRS